MFQLDIVTFYDRIIDRWESKSGLIIIEMFSIIGYFLLIKYIGFEEGEVNKYLLNIFIPLFILTSIFLIWVYSTNRFFIKSSNNITAGIILIIDEDKEKIIVSKIVKKVIHHINNSKDYPNIKLKLLPTNFCIENSEVEKYHKNYSFMYDLIIRLFVGGGNFDSIEKIIIEKLSITFKPKDSNSKKRIYFNTVDLAEDMNLQVGSRNWEYLISNSGIDKKKYFENINEIFLYYLGFYSIYVNRFEDALKILESIYDDKKTIISITKKRNNQVVLNLKPFNLSEGRLSTILVDLFFYAGILSYNNYETEKGLKYFERLEKIIKKHPQKFNQYINMARLSYELGDIEKAINYTEKAKLIKPKSLEIYLNLGFFSILNNNQIEFCKNYNLLFKYRRTHLLNWVEILEFQLRQQKIVKDREEFFNFSISFIDYVFIDSSKKDEFIKTFLSYKDMVGYECFYKLGTSIITNKIKPKSNYRNFKKTKKRKKRKR